MSKEYCSILTQKLHVDGAGTAPPNIKFFLFVETPKPWPENEKSHPDYPKYAYDLAKANIKIHLLAPGSFSKEGFKKILLFSLAADDIGHYNRQEYQVPSTQVKELITALFSGDNIISFDQYKSQDSHIRDLFICGHFAKDYCCGTFGNELFQFTTKFIQEYQDQFENVRLWQTSHLKGHKFAPTTLDFPEGRFWAHLNQDLMVNKILPIQEQSSIGDLRLHIRGLAGTNNFGQIAERELFLKYGPVWTTKKRSISVTPDPNSKNKAIVTITSGTESITCTVTFSEETVTVSDHACGAPSTFKHATVTF